MCFKGSHRSLWSLRRRFSLFCSRSVRLECRLCASLKKVSLLKSMLLLSLLLSLMLSLSSSLSLSLSLQLSRLPTSTLLCSTCRPTQWYCNNTDTWDWRMRAGLDRWWVWPRTAASSRSRSRASRSNRRCQSPARRWPFLKDNNPKKKQSV